MSQETETLDRLYLEWSQFTAARNEREQEAADLLLHIGLRSNDSDIAFKCAQLGAQLSVGKKKLRFDEVFMRWRKLRNQAMSEPSE